MTTIRTAVATIVACVLTGACIGGCLGYGIARFVPGYYRTVFPNPRDPNFDPSGLGVGLGLIQGATLGTVVGLVLVTVFVWREIRRDGSLGATSQPVESMQHSAARRICTITITLLSLGFLLSCAFIIGELIGVRGGYHRRYLAERNLLAGAIENEPAFATVQIEENSDGTAYLVGTMPSHSDFQRLRAAVARAVGEMQVERVTVGVDVNE